MGDEIQAVQSLPARSDVLIADTWDLSSLFPTDIQWEAALAHWEQRIPGYAVCWHARIETGAIGRMSCL